MFPYLLTAWIISTVSSTNGCRNQFSVKSQLEFGTHENLIGFEVEDQLRFGGTGWALSTSLYLSGRYDLTSYGVSGPSPVGEVGVVMAFGFGEKVKSYSPWSTEGTGRRHELSYSYKVYGDLWDTSQLIGAVSYVLRLRGGSVGLLFEDDFFAFQNRDGFRTGSLELALGLGDKPPVGLFAGIKIWTGSTDLNGIVRWPGSYDLLGSPGATNASGIVYGAFSVGPIKLSLGWDSETLRDIFQNGFHHLIGDGRIPPDPSRPDRFYFEISFYRLNRFY